MAERDSHAVRENVDLRLPRGAAPLVLLLAVVALLGAGLAYSAEKPKNGQKAGKTAEKPSTENAAEKPEFASAAFNNETVRGKVVWLETALEQRFGVSTDPAAAETSVVLETPNGQVLLLVPDTRGRAFAVDSRLRDIDLELVVRRWSKMPLVQVLRTLRRKDGSLYEIDYWCDVCAISMAILKDCECCQGPTRLREQKIDEPAPAVGPRP